MTWYERSFGPDYLALYPHRDDAEADRDVDNLIRLVAPPPGRPLLDLGCGAGRHLLALHWRGFNDLTGIDLSQDLLEAAAARLQEAGAEGITLLRADMREIPFPGRFASIISMFTSFGYFDSSDEDERMLTAVYGALAPEGTFLLDTLNRRWTIDHLEPQEERSLGEMHLHIARSITPDGQRVEKETRVLGPDRDDCVYRESVRMYRPEELQGMLAAAGFERISLHGALTGSRLDESSQRTVVVARKGAG